MARFAFASLIVIAVLSDKLFTELYTEIKYKILLMSILGIHPAYLVSLITSNRKKVSFTVKLLTY